jgi:hypothetical protein
MNFNPILALVLALSPFTAPSTPELAPAAQGRGGGCIPAVITQGLSSTQVCLGATIVFEVQATGSDLHYAWTHGGQPVPGATRSTLTLPSVTLAERGIWCVEVSNACSSVSSCARVSISDCGGTYCTLTMGAYGNPNGQWNGMNRVELITSLLAQGPLLLGEAGRSLTIEPGAPGAQCIIDRLPANGRPAALPDFGDQTLDPTSCQTDPALPIRNDRFQNVLLGQAIALSLNLRLDSELGGLVVCTQMTTTNGIFVVDSSVIEAMVEIGGGHGVESLLALANRALAGGQTNGVSLATISAAVDAVNRAFDECATLEGCQ